MPAPKGWFKKFSKKEKVKIIPPSSRFDKTAEEFFRILRKELGNKVEIERRGSGALGIFGKGEVDTYLRVSKKEFWNALGIMMNKFGVPGKVEEYRARFNHKYKGIEFELILIYENHPDEIEGRKFFNYLKTHPKALKEYEEIKIKSAKVSELAYQLQKNKFIKKILRLCR